MSQLIQIRKKAQLTLPQSVRQELGLKEGDFLDVRIENGAIVLKVKELVDREQAWFWTKRWQEGEAEAEEDIRSGRLHHFADASKAIDFLHKTARNASAKSSEPVE